MKKKRTNPDTPAAADGRGGPVTLSGGTLGGGRPNPATACNLWAAAGYCS
jgi:hypothetical protein